MRRNVDTGEIQALIERIKSFENGEWQNVRKKCVDNLANRVVALAKKRTPVDTGNLRRNFFIDGAEESDEEYKVTVINNVEYASYVEYGHRTRNHRGWAEGKFMLESAVEKVDKNAKRYIKGIVVRALSEMMNGD